ncbi:DUF6385 domain-containing protein [Paenibacillus prosopidis]|uniref:DUF6385 domain-containing protein n=1 Tax=Paenibacillus prosopidis TaxID=630520 RepID=A0A368W6R4_9BACL|nr:DUF6385 domain-containing protein [Paenibacillus prosopidis]RCW49526.1 hypothetical protein DFP97_104184 [Paenibacillus prosopidis]
MVRCRIKTCRRRAAKAKKKCLRKKKTAVAVRFIAKRICGLVISDRLRELPPQNTSKLTVYSYAIVNRSKEPIIARVEVSPNKDDFASDREATVPPDETIVIVPTRFLKYTRIALQTASDASIAAECDVYFQAQTFIGYKPAG